MFKFITLKTVASIFASIFSLSLGTVSSVSLTITTRPPSEFEQNKTKALEELNSIDAQISALKTQAGFARTLRRGMEGEDVRQLQQDLNKILGPAFPQDYITGRFGTVTEKSLKQFQAANHLSASGVLDDKSRMILIEDAAGVLNPKPISVEVTKEFIASLVDPESIDSTAPTSTPDASTLDSSTGDGSETYCVDGLKAEELDVLCVSRGFILPSQDFCPDSNAPIVDESVTTPTAAPSTAKTPTPLPSISNTPTPVATPAPTAIKTSTPTPTPTKNHAN